MWHSRRNIRFRDFQIQTENVTHAHCDAASEMRKKNKNIVAPRLFFLSLQRDKPKYW